MSNTKSTKGKKMNSKPREEEQILEETQAEPIRLYRPDEIKAYLDQYVIGQDEAKRVLSVAVYNHFKMIGFNEAYGENALGKSNIILLGETGCGKTLLVKTIARLLNVPCYIGNATSITESGYVGDDIESLLVGLLRECDYDIERAEKGIVFIDEIDKIAKLKFFQRPNLPNFSTQISKISTKSNPKPKINSTKIPMNPIKPPELLILTL